ncbi:unnamed protein product [Cuscuta campestris]|uniref:Uncharacterized protein n=1 Tax=Cuscuta campestris TaxID=132261 RepID=A0A484KEV8_9ASTE|nr:unnamed protein product [Cuscuta campestris]
MNFTGFVNLDASDDEVLHADQSRFSKPHSPPQMSEMEGATTGRCTPLHELIRDKKVKSLSATHLSRDDRVDSPQVQAKAKSKETGASSSHVKAQKRKGPQKSSSMSKKKKTGSLNLEGESIEEAFLALAKRLHKAGAISENVGRSLLEARDQVSQLTLLLDSAKLEINDQAKREKRLEEELRAEKAKREEESARSAQVKEDGRRKVAELDEALAQVEESARAKEEAFPAKAAQWAAGHHAETARSILAGLEETMASSRRPGITLWMQRSKRAKIATRSRPATRLKAPRQSPASSPVSTSNSDIGSPTPIQQRQYSSDVLPSLASSSGVLPSRRRRPHSDLQAGDE